MSNFFKAINSEIPQFLAIIRWHFWSAIIWLVDLVVKPFLFTEKGVPRNPASTEPGHKPWMLKLQQMVGKTIVCLQGASFHPAVVAYRASRNPELNPQARLRSMS